MMLEFDILSYSSGLYSCIMMTKGLANFYNMWSGYFIPEISSVYMLARGEGHVINSGVISMNTDRISPPGVLFVWTEGEL